MPNQTPNPEQEKQALEYARRLFADYLDWYKTADSKAQVILGLDGAFLTFLTGSAFAKPEDALKVICRFGIETWVLLALMCAAMTVSIFSAIRCLWSRTYSKSDLGEIFSKLKVDPQGAQAYPAEVMWFFQMVHALKPEAFKKQLLNVDAEFETKVLASQIVEVSRTVTEKHRWINFGFSGAAASLILFVAGMISYVAHLR